MRLAIFTETFLPKIDGIANTLCYLLEYAAARGHEALLFAPAGGPETFAGAPVISFRGCPFPLYRELRLVPPLVPLRSHLRRFRPDLVHVVQPLSLGVAGLWHARQLKIPVVASYHTDIPNYAHRWGMGGLEALIWSLMRTIHRQADRNLVPSQATLRQLQANHFSNLGVWSRGVDARRFHPVRREPAQRMALSGGDPAPPLLLYVGRLSPEKRIDLLRPLFDPFPHVRLAIVGDGPARPALESAFAGTNTVFTGFLRGEALAAAYAAADIFVFPSPHETLGNVVLEALASGLAVVAAASGGPLDLLQHEQNALLFRPDDSADLVIQVGRLLTDPDLAGRLRSRGRVYAEGRSWERVLDDLFDQYQQVVDGHKSRSWRLEAGVGSL